MARENQEPRIRKRDPGDLPTSAELAKALSHPLRIQALTILIDRIAGPKEIAEQLGIKVSRVSYHVRQLESIGLVKLVGEKPVRGAIAHYYQAVEPEKTRALLGQIQIAATSQNGRDDA